MAEEVGNLKVKIGMDSAEFQKSMTSLNKNLQTLGQEFRTLQNKGKDWGSTIDGLQSKQRKLTELFDGQKDKVQRLAEQYKKVASEQGEHSKQTENLAYQLAKAEAEMQKTETELGQITSELQKQEAELKRSQSGWNKLGESVTAFGEKLKSIGDKMTSVGKELSLKLSTPILALGTAAVKTAADFEAQMDRVGAIAGATAEEMEKLSATAMELGASTSKSASEVAIGMENMAAMGFEVNEIMAAMPGIISAAEASGADMAQTADVVAASLNMFGLEASEASRVADILAQSANQSAADITDLQYALKYAGPPAAALGLSIEETTAAIGLMTDAGMKGEQAGTTLRSALLSLLQPSEKNSKLMDTLGIAITDTDGKMLGISAIIANLIASLDGMTEANKAATLSSIFGKEAVSGMMTLIEAGPEKIDAMTASLENSAGASKEAADKMKDNLKGALEELGGAFETLSIQLGNILIPMVRDVAVKFQSIVEKFSNLSESTQKVILAVGGLVAAIGPIILVAGALISSVGSIMTVVGGLSTAIAGAGGMMAILGSAFAALTGPIGIAIAAIAAIGVGTVALIKHFRESSIEVEDWKDKVSESTAEAVGSFMELSDEASSQLSKLSITGQAVTKEMATSISNTFSQMGQQVLAEMQADHSEQLEAISSFYANSNVLVEEEEATILAKTAEYHANKEKQIAEGNARIAEIMNAASNEKRSLTLAEEAEISRIHATMKDSVIEYMTESQLEQQVILETMKNNASKISAQQVAEVVQNSIKQKDEVIDEAEEQYKKAVAEIIKQRDEMGVISGQQAKQLIEDAAKQRDETIKAAEDAHLKVVTEAQKQASEHVSQVDWETGQVKSKWQLMKDDVSKKTKELKDDIKTYWSNIWIDTKAKVSDIKNEAVNKFQELKQGVQDKMSEAKSNIEEIWNEAQTFLRNIDLFQIGKDIIQGLIDGIGSMADAVWKKVTSIVDGIKGAITGKNALDMHSPSKVTTEYGEFTGQGFAIGIDKSISMVKKAASGLAEITKQSLNVGYGSQGSINSYDQSRTYQPSVTIINQGGNMSPAQQARQTLNAQRQLAMEWGV